MDGFIKKQWLQIQAFLDDLPRDTKMLIVSLVVILGLAGFVIVQYAASSEMVSLQQVDPDRQSLVLTRLEAAGIKADTQGGMIRVSQEKQSEALAVLAQFDLLAADTTAAFDDMIKRQSPWMPDRQNKQAFLIAKQKVLGQIITKMVGIRGADVMVSMPDNTGFAATHVTPSASVTVVPDGRNAINRRQVEAIAGLVSGAVGEGIKPQDVVVIDASSGRRHTVKNPDEVAADDNFELIQAQESYYRNKIEQHLGYIPGVMVAVSVLADPVRLKQTEQWTYEKTEPLKREMSRTEDRTNTKRSGSPGAQSNVGASIETGGANTIKEEIAEKTTEYDKKNLTERAVMKSVGSVREVSATVNVPRPYFVGLYRQQNPPGEGENAAGQEIDDAKLKSLIDEQLKQIEQSVQPLVTAEAAGVVRAYMIPDPRELIAAMETRPQASGVMMVMQQDWVKSAGLGALALLSLAIMFGMVRKATQAPQVPTVEELAGLPPLPEPDDVMEATEGEDALAGVELDDDEVRARQIAEQLGAMVREDPTEAAALISKWMQEDE